MPPRNLQHWLLEAVLIAAVASSMSAAVPIPAKAAPEINRPAAVTISAPGAYSPLNPVRVVDSRIGQGFSTIPANSYREVSLASVVPPTAASVALNVTSVNPVSPGFLTLSAAGTSAQTSNVNYRPGQITSNLAVTRLANAGGIRVMNSSPSSSNVVIDVQGYYVGGGTPTADGTFVGVAPVRMLDTRNTTSIPAGATRVLQVGGSGGVAASGTDAALMNVTVISSSAAGYVTLYPAGDTRPTSSNVNFGANSVRANMSIVQLSMSGAVEIFNAASSSLDVVIDVFGYTLYNKSVPAVAGSYFSNSPYRDFDTRRDGVKIPAGNLYTSFYPPGVLGIACNLTVTEPAAAGWVVLYPGEVSRPAASSLNFVAGDTISSLVFSGVSLSTGELNLFNGAAGGIHALCDAAGYFVDPSSLNRLTLD